MCSKENPCKLLIVEDDIRLINLFIAKNLNGDFHDFALDVTIAQSLKEATEIIQNAKVPFDVISIDLGLPDSQGAATYDAIQAIAPDPPKFVYTAGNIGENFYDVVVAHGAERYLLKTEWKVDQYLTLLHYGAGQHRARMRRREITEHYKKLSESQAEELNAIRNQVPQESDAQKALDRIISNFRQVAATG
jgi:DNA-binding NarL/FixJ family response regulator